MSGRTLVAYASKGGATEKYAILIAEKLRERGFDVDLADLRKVEVTDLAPYDNFVSGAGVRIGLVYGKARKFLKRKDLTGKRLAVFLCTGMAVEDPEKAGKKYLEPLVAKYGLAPVLSGSFPGMMPGPGGKQQDKTDHEAAGRWAEELASLFRSGQLIELRTLDELNARSLGLITGYASEEKYAVRWEDSESSTTFTLEKTSLKRFYVKLYDPPDGELLERYAKAVRGGFSVGAFDGVEQVGVVIADVEEWNLSLWVWEFHVAEARRGQGIGRLMIEELVRRGAQAGLRTIVCETQNTNAPAMDFYRSMGFRVEGIDMSYYGNSDWPDGEVAVFMKRRLG